LPIDANVEGNVIDLRLVQSLNVLGDIAVPAVSTTVSYDVQSEREVSTEMGALRFLIAEQPENADSPMLEFDMVEGTVNVKSPEQFWKA
jgi:hypothetical protein